VTGQVDALRAKLDATTGLAATWEGRAGDAAKSLAKAKADALASEREARAAAEAEARAVAAAWEAKVGKRTYCYVYLASR